MVDDKPTDRTITQEASENNKGRKMTYLNREALAVEKTKEGYHISFTGNDKKPQQYFLKTETWNKITGEANKDTPIELKSKTEADIAYVIENKDLRLAATLAEFRKIDEMEKKPASPAAPPKAEPSIPLKPPVTPARPPAPKKNAENEPLNKFIKAVLTNQKQDAVEVLWKEADNFNLLMGNARRNAPVLAAQENLLRVMQPRDPLEAAALNQKRLAAAQEKAANQAQIEQLSVLEKIFRKAISTLHPAAGDRELNRLLESNLETARGEKSLRSLLEDKDPIIKANAGNYLIGKLGGAELKFLLERQENIDKRMEQLDKFKKAPLPKGRTPGGR